jgi:hypothetical protein
MVNFVFIEKRQLRQRMKVTKINQQLNLQPKQKLMKK